MGKRAGAGFVAYDHNGKITEQVIPLGHGTTINQAELIAIHDVAIWAINNIATAATKITIHSDSLTTITKLSSKKCISKLALETARLLNTLAERINYLALNKVKAHIGIEGNEVADALAKKGATLIPEGPEPYILPNKSHILNEINDMMKSETLNRIKSASIKKEHKSRLTTIVDNPKSLNNLYKFVNITDINTLTQMISDQNHLANNENKRDELVVPNCKHCNGTKETSEHFIGKCPAYSALRQQFFGRHTTTINEIIESNGIGKLLTFIKSTGRIDDEFVRYYIE